ncbi:MAG TPA: hypothetical protein PLO39_09845 [Saprospiraceae bacterium]|nr:hypothetical protein [Saprospiraceae bacterium]
MLIELTSSEAITLRLAIHHSIMVNNEMLDLCLDSSDYRKHEIEKLRTIQNKLNGSLTKR